MVNVLNRQLDDSKEVNRLVIKALDHNLWEPFGIASWMNDYYALCHDFIINEIEEISEQEIPTLSRAYSALYDRFNEKYFDGKLPRYRVRVFYNIGLDHEGNVLNTTIDSSEKLIRLRITKWETRMVTWLLRVMVRVAVNFDHSKEQIERDRLGEFGAPVNTAFKDGLGEPDSCVECAEALGFVHRIVITAEDRDHPFFPVVPEE